VSDALARLHGSTSAYRPDVLLLPYQQKWFSDRSPVKIAEKSRRTGFTWTTAGEWADDAARGKADGWYVGYTEEQGEEFIRDVATWARLMHGVAVEHCESVIEDVDPDTGESQSIKVFRVDFANGKRVTALNSKPRNLRGKQGNICLDEAAFHDDVPGLLKAAGATRMWGGRIAIISTHNGVENEFNKLLESVRAGKLRYSIHRVTIDDALADGLCRRICQKTGVRWTPKREAAWRQEQFDLYGDGSEEELLCVPSKGGIAYFARDVIDGCMQRGRPILRMNCDAQFAMRPEPERVRHVDAWIRTELMPLLAKLPKDRPHYLGEDYGRVADLMVLAPGTLTRDLLRDVPFLIELSNVPFEQQKQVAFALISGLPNFQQGHFDATGNGAYLAEVCAQKFGTHRIEQIKVTENWHIEAWPTTRAAFEERKLLLPADDQLLSDFGAVKRVNGIPKLPNANTVKVVQNGEVRTVRRHGDAAVAIAMLTTATRAPVPTKSKFVHVQGL
jgi:phage FluMu gp28-like protein